jgi:hypothetical protein
LTFGSIFFGTMDILPTQKDAAQNLGRFISQFLVGFAAIANDDRRRRTRV